MWCRKFGSGRWLRLMKDRQVAAQASGRLGSARARQLSTHIKLSASLTEGFENSRWFLAYGYALYWQLYHSRYTLQNINSSLLTSKCSVTWQNRDEQKWIQIHVNFWHDTCVHRDYDANTCRTNPCYSRLLPKEKTRILHHNVSQVFVT